MKCKKGYTLKKGKCVLNKSECVYQNFKKQISKGRKITFFFIALLLLVIIFLPTGIDDAYTTIPLLALLGWKIYLVIALVVLILFLIFMKKLIKMKRAIFSGCVK